MKELSIEQKARRYDEAIERANSLLSSNELGNAWIYKLLPELKESEDERIRKELISFFTERAKYTEDSTFNGLSSKEIIAWLEKQGEQRSDDIDNKFIRMRETKPANIAEFLDRLTTVEQEFLWEHIAKIREFDKEEQKPANWFQELEDKLDNATPQQLAEWKEKYFKEEPAAWSEEDERIYQSIMDDTVQENQLDDKQINWLKSLKDRVQPQPKQEILEKLEEWLDEYVSDLADVDTASLICSFTNYLDGKLPKSIRPQPKQEWSEEDERLFQIIIDILDRENHLGNLSHTDLIACVRKLKSLRPRSQWKPSDEQMDALHYVTNFDYGGHKATLVSLYEQLKKLK